MDITFQNTDEVYAKSHTQDQTVHMSGQKDTQLQKLQRPFHFKEWT